jgi:hypothetical protein
MCNAWNHSSDCRCGWGGTGHLGQGGSFSANRGVGATFKTYRELLIGASNPNAHCPECGIKVFFYESPYGGRVFFDHPGPPWPKHPCTSSNERVSSVRRIEIDFHSRIHVSTSAFRDGWMPFLCEIVDSIPNDKSIQRLEGWLDGERKSFYVRDGRLSEGAPFFLKKENEQWFVSTLAGDSESVEPKTVRAFIFESEVHDLAPPVVARPHMNQPRQTKRPAPNTRSRQSSDEASQKAKPKAPKKKALKRKQQKKPNQPPPPPPIHQRTSLEVAMEDAQKRQSAAAPKGIHRQPG